MPYSQLSEENIDYVLDEFDANVQLDDTLHELHRAGYVGVTMATIRECLHQYGRISSLNQPIVAGRGQSAPCATPTNSFQQNPENPNTERTRDTPTPPPDVEVPPLRWNSEADRISLDLYHSGKRVPQISAQLCSNGYKVTSEQVAASLTSQGEQNLRWHAEHHPPPPSGWDAQADAFAIDAHNLGETVPQIAASLCRNGYVASKAQVATSLNSQGVLDVRW